MPSEKVDLVSECRVIDYDTLNGSNHRPIYYLVMFPHLEQMEPILKVTRSVHWRCTKSHEIEGSATMLKLSVEMPHLMYRVQIC